MVVKSPSYSGVDLASPDADITVIRVIKGGPGSGHFSHSGIPGKVGGSLPSGGSWRAPVDFADKQAKDAEENSEYIKQALKDAHLTKESADIITRSMLKDCNIFIRVPDDVIDNIMESGKLKNQFESGTSRGVLDNDFRADSEMGLFGIDTENPDNHPVYGYMHDTIDGYSPESAEALGHYGGIIVSLNDDIRDRTTFTNYDSLENQSPEEGMLSIPSSVNNPSYASMIVPELLPFGRFGRYSWRLQVSAFRRSKPSERQESYMEAQIHGGIRLKDIRAIYFPRYRQYIEGIDMTPNKLQKWLEEHNLNIKIDTYKNL